MSETWEIPSSACKLYVYMTWKGNSGRMCWKTHRDCTRDNCPIKVEVKSD